MRSAVSLQQVLDLSVIARLWGQMGRKAQRRTLSRYVAEECEQLIGEQDSCARIKANGFGIANLIAVVLVLSAPSVTT
jgi:hypothetical protein